MEAKERVYNVLKAKKIDPYHTVEGLEDALEIAYKTGQKDALKWVKGMLGGPLMKLQEAIIKKLKEI